ncbi:MAG: beta-phosphoglucomutase [Spirochaetaceae bacterium]|jgi:beta-phosphoglucomutase|nr:beta-phosphoglucomutase [Spirochaetaceae bacterium]
MINSLINDDTIRGWIFDLDGVITDTAEFHYQAWQKMADEENLIFDKQINEKLRGVSRRASLDIILNGKTLSEDKIQNILEAKNRYYCDLLRKLSEDDILPEIVPLLKKLQSNGKKIAIASASRNTDYIIDHLHIRKYFDGIASGGLVKRAKPAPDIFLHAAGQLGLAVDNCIVIEDAEAGVTGALKAGFRTIGIGPENRVGHANFRFDSTDGLKIR